MKRFKRFTSLTLSVMMMASLLPASVLAEEMEAAPETEVVIEKQVDSVEDTETEIAADAEAEAEVTTDAEAEAEAEIAADAEAEEEITADAEAELEAEITTDAETEAEAETTAETELSEEIETAQDYITKGTFGENDSMVYYYNHDTYELIISTAGKEKCAMPDFSEENPAPWEECSYETVTIRPGVTYIGAYSFYGKSILKTVTIGRDVTKIGDYAFAETGLTSLEIPANVSSFGTNVFSDCKKLSSVTLPKGLKNLGYYMFFNCEKLANIDLPDGLESISMFAFSGCKSLEEVDIPNSVTYTGYNAFAYCENLRKVTMPVEMNGIADGLFSSCYKLEKVVIPTGTKWLGNELIAYSGVQTVIINNEIETFGRDTFLYDTSLTEGRILKDIYIPDSYYTKFISVLGDSGLSYSNGKFYVYDLGTESLKEVKVHLYKNIKNYTVSSIPSKVYDGTAYEPKVTVYNDTDTLIEGADYTVYYRDNINLGKGTIYIVGKGNFVGTIVKQFNIKPHAAVISSVTNAASGMNVKWSAVPEASGYYIYRGSEMIKDITNPTTVSYLDPIAKTNGTKYTYKVVAYYEMQNGTIIKASASAAKSYYRLSRPTISSLTSPLSGALLVKWTKNSKATGYKLQYGLSSTFSDAKTSTITNYSTVSKTIKSLSKGKTYYVRIRAYKTVGGTYYYSAYSDKKSVKIKK